jgi:very-short-patch-repair endonuclease/uncharacterized protein YifE (UPF0438 family)
MKMPRRKRNRIGSTDSLGSFVIGDKPISSIGGLKKVSNPTQKYARMRRKHPTKAEEELQNILNSIDHGVYKGKFQREWAFAGRWILDFFFVENRFGIEVDGKYHNSDEQKTKDAKKTRACEKFGVTLLRLTDEEVFGNREALLLKIRKGYEKASQRHSMASEPNTSDSSKASKIQMETPITELTEPEKRLIEKHLLFYRALAIGKHKPTTEAQQHFVAMCEGRVKAETEHEIAYVKYMRIQRAYKDSKSAKKEGIPEYEEGLPRPGWSTDDDLKKKRSGNYAEMKKGRRGE